MNGIDRHNEIINNQVLVKILSEFGVKQVIELEAVSKQFQTCVQLTLRSKKCLIIGIESSCDEDMSELFGREVLKEIRHNFSPMFSAREVEVYDLVAGNTKLEKLLQKCPNIESISLSDCFVNCGTFETIAKTCKHLKHLSLDEIYCSISVEMWHKVCHLLSDLRLTHFTVSGLRVLSNNSGYFYRSFEYSSILLQKLSAKNNSLINLKKVKKKSNKTEK